MDGQDREEKRRLLMMTPKDRKASQKLLELLAVPAMALLKKHFPKLHSDDRVELINDVFMKLIGNPSVYDPLKGSLDAYFCVCVKNAAVDFVRKECSRSKVIRLDQDTISRYPDAAMPSDDADGRLEIVDNRLKKMKLDPLELDLLETARNTGMKGPWAQALGLKYGMTANAVSQTWHRLKRQLRDVG